MHLGPPKKIKKGRGWAPFMGDHPLRGCNQLLALHITKEKLVPVTAFRDEFRPTVQHSWLIVSCYKHFFCQAEIASAWPTFILLTLSSYLPCYVIVFTFIFELPDEFRQLGVVLVLAVAKGGVMFAYSLLGEFLCGSLRTCFLLFQNWTKNWFWNSSYRKIRKALGIFLWLAS